MNVFAPNLWLKHALHTYAESKTFRFYSQNNMIRHPYERMSSESHLVYSCRKEWPLCFCLNLAWYGLHISLLNDSDSTARCSTVRATPLSPFDTKLHSKSQTLSKLSFYWSGLRTFKIDFLENLFGLQPNDAQYSLICGAFLYILKRFEIMTGLCFQFCDH